MGLWLPDKKILTPAQEEYQRAMRALRPARRHGVRFHDSPTMVQIHFLFRDDDGDETGATDLELPDVNHTITVSADTKIRVRIQVEETAGNAFSNFGEEWYYDKNAAGSYAIVPASSGGTVGIEYTSSTWYTDGTDCTQQCDVGGTFLSNNDGMTHSTNTGAGNVPDYVGSDKAEFEFCINLVYADLTDGDTFDFRIYEGGSPITTYTVTPRLTIDKPAPTEDLATKRVYLGQPGRNLMISGG